MSGGLSLVCLVPVACRVVAHDSLLSLPGCGPRLGVRGGRREECRRW